MSDIKMDVIEFKKIMVEKEIDGPTELSKISGINRNTLGDILSGKRQPSATVMVKLIKALDIEPEKAGEIFFAQYLRTA